MMVSGIGSFSQAGNVYAYANSHYNQVQDAAVTPVTPVRPVARLEDQEDQLKLASANPQDRISAEEERAAIKEKANLAESYKDQDVVQYNMSNPYDVARMSIENSLLSGMNIDMLA